MSEAEFIQQIITDDKHFIKDSIYLKIKQLEKDTSFKSYNNWQNEVSIEFENSYYDINKNTTSTSIYEKERRNNSQKITLSTEKYFLESPASLSMDITRDILDKDITRYKQDEHHSFYEARDYETNYSINYTYPFLKHNSQASSLKTYKNDILDLASEKLDFLDAKEDFLVDKLEDFLNLAALYENDKVLEKYWKDLDKIKLIVDSDNNKLTNELNLADNEIIKNNNALYELKQNLELSLDNNNINLENLSLNYQKRANFINNYEIFIKNNNRDLLRYDIDKQIKQNDIKYYDNQILPELDLVLSIERQSDDGNTLSTKFDNLSTEYTGSINFSMPLGGDITDEKNLAVAKLNLTKINLDYNAKFNDILADIKSLDLSLKNNQKSIKRYQALIDKINLEIKVQYENYLNKIISLKDFIDNLKQQRDLVLDYIDLILQYQLNILEYNDILDNIIK